MVLTFYQNTPPQFLHCKCHSHKSRFKSAAAPTNREGRKLDTIGRCQYSLSAFILRVASYLTAMGAYHRHLWNKALPLLNTLTDDNCLKGASLHKEAMSLFDYPCPIPTATTCLSPFFSAWREITSDSWVLTIISEGYAIEFQSLSPLGNYVSTIMTPPLRDEVVSQYNRTTNSNRSIRQVLFPLFNCSKERRWTQTHFRSLSIKPLYYRKTFQDEHSRTDHSSPPKRGLVCCYRRQRRLLSYINTSRPPEVLALRHRRYYFLVQISPFWPFYCTTYLYKMPSCSNSGCLPSHLQYHCLPIS